MGVTEHDSRVLSNGAELHPASRAVRLSFRESKEADGDLGAPAYIYAGPASYVNHSGDRPVRILWTMDYELPDEVFQEGRIATG